MLTTFAATYFLQQGYALPHAILRQDMGGRDISAFLHKTLSEKGPQYQLSQEIVKDIKEKLCCVAV